MNGPEPTVAVGEGGDAPASLIHGQVSILIPCFNAAPYLAHAIRSTLDQTHRAIQVVVVDDGSTDGSARIADSFDDPRVSCFRQPHLGSCAARNRALERATGEYVLYLDADDYLTQNAVEVLICGIDGYDAAYADAVLVDAEGERLSYRDQSPVCRDPVISMLEKAPYCGTVLLRRESISSRWSSKYDSVDEFYFFSSLAVRGIRFRHVAGPVLHYRQHSTEHRKSVRIRSYSTTLLAAFSELAEALSRRGALTPMRRRYFNFIALHFHGQRDFSREISVAANGLRPRALRAVGMCITDRTLRNCLGTRRIIATVCRYVRSRV